MSASFPDQRRLPPSQALHVVALAALAIAQPLFDLLGRNASFFVAHHASRADVITFGVLTFVVPALVLILARYLISFVSREAAYVFHLVTLAILGAFALTPPVVRAWGVKWIPALAIAIAIAVLLVSLYRRFGGFRRFLSIIGLASIALVALFLFGSPVRDIVLPGAAPASRIVSTEPARSDTPVFVVLFDELATTSFITPDGDINAERFPNLARLAEGATWYRRATTVGLRTDQAVPAILTGRRVPRRQVPSSFAYPDNIFTLLSRTHDLHVHESVTQLCPPELCGRENGEPTTGLGPLFADAAVVYGHLVLPADVAQDRLPPLGDRWAGFTRDPAGGGPGGGDPVAAWLRGALTASKEQHEGAVLERFLKGIEEPEGKPQFSWVHLQVPHPPWRYLPTGQVYPTGDTTPGYRNFTWSKNQYLANEVRQRSLLQSTYADRLLGDIVHRLKEQDVWNETMLVVVADHGATWEAGHSRRDIEGKERTSLLGVPLFVKYPGQKVGSVDDTNAETSDVLATVADVAGVDVPWETHGSSLRKESRRPDKVVFDGKRERVVQYPWDEARAQAAHIEELFGDGSDEHDLYGFGPDRGLIGTRVVDLQRGERANRTIAYIADDDALDAARRSAPIVPAFVRARFTGDPPKDGRRVALSVNGRIAGVGRTFTEDGRAQVALMTTPEFLKRRGRNAVMVFFLEGRDTLIEIGP